MRPEISAGIVFAVLATLSWALNFISPYVTGPYSIYDLMAVRFILSGIIGLVILLILRHQLRKLGTRRCTTAAALGILGYLIYSICVVGGVYFGGPVMTPAFIALVPVLVTLIGNFTEQSFPWRRLATPLTIITFGLMLVNLTGSEHIGQHSNSWSNGLIFSIGAVLSWLSFSWLNQKLYGNFIKESSAVWTGLMMSGAGLATLCALPVLLLLGLLKLPEIGYIGEAAVTLYMWSFLIALMSSVVGAWAWNAASSRLPMSISGQLIALESLFATMLGLAFNGRYPTVLEAIGLATVLVGVILAVRIMFSSPSLNSQPEQLA